MATSDAELVRWHRVDDPASGCHGRDEAAEYVKRALANEVTAEVRDLREAADRVVVIVQVHHPPEWGDDPEPHAEVVTVRDGEIDEIIVYPAVADALEAVGEQDRPPCAGWRR